VPDPALAVQAVHRHGADRLPAKALSAARLVAPGARRNEDCGMTTGDYDLRGLDFETYLVGPVTDKIIDADRLVRSRYNNGFPNWTLYRTVYAGDTHLRTQLRDWCVAYSIAVAESGFVRKIGRASCRESV